MDLLDRSAMRRARVRNVDGPTTPDRGPLHRACQSRLPCVMWADSLAGRWSRLCRDVGELVERRYPSSRLVRVDWTVRCSR